MKVAIKRIDKELPLPAYKTKGAVAFDLCARQKIAIKPQTLGYIPTNVVVQTPPGYVLILAPRSSMPKRGLIYPHGIGLVDADYCGDDDELILQVFNITKKTVTVDRGERVGQAIFVKFMRVSEWEEKSSLNKKSRGGFGSTGVA